MRCNAVQARKLAEMRKEFEAAVDRKISAVDEAGRKALESQNNRISQDFSSQLERLRSELKERQNDLDRKLDKVTSQVCRLPTCLPVDNLARGSC